MSGSEEVRAAPHGSSRRRFLRDVALGAGIFGGSIAASLWAQRWSGSDTPGSGDRRFFVAAFGDDDATGRTSDDPWRSITRVNAALAAGDVRRGDTVLFRRGDEFFGNVHAVPPIEGAGPRLTLGAYGVGPRPKISGYKVVERTDGWAPHGAGVWKIDLTDQSTHGGNTTNDSANTGFIMADGVIHGEKKWRIDDLDREWDFFDDGRFLYVRSPQNPASITKSLRVAVDGILIEGQSRLLVEGLELTGSGGHGYRQYDSSDTEVVDCRIGPVGGARLYETTRYGNGIELWMGSENAMMHRNEISDVYDAATTLQGEQDGAVAAIARCHFVGNTIFNCSQSFEYWVTGSNNTPGAGIVDCSFSDNVCVGGGRGWGHLARPDKAGLGNFVMAYRQEAPIGIEVTRNVFFDAIDCYAFSNTNGARFKTGYTSDMNTIALHPGTRIQSQLGYTIEEAGRWTGETGLDANSRWIVIPTELSPVDALSYVRDNLESLRVR